jgi:hypothetical protein
MLFKNKLAACFFLLCFHLGNAQSEVDSVNEIIA